MPRTLGLRALRGPAATGSVDGQAAEPDDPEPDVDPDVDEPDVAGVLVFVPEPASDVVPSAFAAAPLSGFPASDFPLPAVPASAFPLSEPPPSDRPDVAERESLR